MILIYCQKLRQCLFYFSLQEAYLHPVRDNIILIKIDSKEKEKMRKVFVTKGRNCSDLNKKVK